MRNDTNATKNKNNIPKTIKKYLSLAAAGLSLVSFYTTAQGLHEFVFHEIWQAYLISAAIQITLFVLNLKLIHYIKQNRFIAIAVWLFALSASVTFSYVYISNEIYNNDLYYSDVDRMMSEEIMEMSLDIDDYLTNYKLYCKDAIDKYCSHLTVSNIQNQTTFTTSAQESLNECIISLKKLELFTDTDTVISEIQTIAKNLPSDYTDTDMEATISSLEIIKENLTDSKDDLEIYLQTETKEWDSINDRLKQYSNFQDPQFIELQKQNNAREGQLESYQNKVTKLSSAMNNIDLCINNLMYEKNNNSYNKINTARQKLLMEMNKDDLDTNNIQTYINQIYEVLIEENSSENSVQIENYYCFKEAIRLYIKLQDLQNSNQNILNTLDSTYTASSAENTTNYDFDDTDSLSSWKKQWYDCLNNLREIIRACPAPQDLIINDTISSTEASSIHLTEANPVVFIDRNYLLNKLSSMERSYLDDINKMEKSGNLLNTKYRAMAFFSLIAAIFLDVFGASIGIFLYYTGPTSDEKEPPKVNNSEAFNTSS